MANIKLFEQFSGIEDKERLSDSIVKLLNEQIKNELDSSQIYRAMSCWADDQGLPNACAYYFKSAQEELVHMDKIYQYLFDKNCKAVVPVCDKAPDSYKDITEVVQASLDHEITVSENWNDIANLALKEKDNNTYIFSQWFINEQVEEESKFRDMLFHIRLDMPKWKIEELFK